MTVMIISQCADVHTQAVMVALAGRNAKTELLDLSEFPEHLALSIAFERNTHRFELRRRDGGLLNFDSVSSVWWRRPQPFQLPSEMDSAHKTYVRSESATAFHGLYQSLKAYWINPPERDLVAQHKPYQLAVAQEIGFDIPETLMTNNVSDARAFWRQHNGEVIYKQFLALPDTWRETRRLVPADEAFAENVALAPVIFQRHVPAVADLRVTAVGGNSSPPRLTCAKRIIRRMSG